MMVKISKQMAEILAKSEWWCLESSYMIALFQLSVDRLCMPFDLYHEKLEDALDRPVYTHELSQPETLIKELVGQIPKATFDDILNKLPGDKPIIIVNDD